MAGRQGQCKMHDSMRSKFYWPRVANDAYTTVSNGTASARNWLEPKPEKQLRLFRASDLLEFIATDILEPLHQTVDDRQYVVAVTERLLMLIRALLI